MFAATRCRINPRLLARIIHGKLCSNDWLERKAVYVNDHVHDHEHDNVNVVVDVVVNVDGISNPRLRLRLRVAASPCPVALVAVLPR